MGDIPPLKKSIDEHKCKQSPYRTQPALPFPRQVPAKQTSPSRLGEAGLAKQSWPSHDPATGQADIICRARANLGTQRPGRTISQRRTGVVGLTCVVGRQCVPLSFGEKVAQPSTHASEVVTCNPSTQRPYPRGWNNFGKLVPEIHEMRHANP